MRHTQQRREDTTRDGRHHFLAERHFSHAGRIRCLGSLRGHRHVAYFGSGSRQLGDSLEAVRGVLSEGWMRKKGVVRIVFWSDGRV